MNRCDKRNLAQTNESIDFLNKIPKLHTLRDAAKKNTVTYGPEDFELSVELKKNETLSNITVIQTDVVDACQSYNKYKSVVLNFASATHAGGGYITGATAQEEALCRASSLYYCLVGNEMYQQPKSKTGLYENYFIYSPEVPFFRDADGQLLDIDNNYTTSVITAAAPNAKIAKIKNLDGVPSPEVVIKYRIYKVLELAKHYQYNVIILGAWGCGVFGNNPHFVAKTFKTALKHYSFEHVIFAIHDTKTVDIFNSIFT